MNEDIKQKLMNVIKSGNQWFNISTEEIITTEELKKRVDAGQISLKNVSSNPKILPIFGDIKDDLEKFFNFKIAIPNTKDYLQCWEGIKGPSNPGNSCFMDSVLMAIFAFPQSPFYQVMIEENVKSSKFLLCDLDIDEDVRIREEIQESLRNMINVNFKGKKNDNCNELRRLVGKECRTEGDVDLSKGIHEPFEFLNRLMGVFSYGPTIIRTTRFRSATYDQYSPNSRSSEEVNPYVWVDTVTNTDFKKLDFEDVLRPNVVEVDEFDFVHEVKVVEKAEVLIFSIDRRNAQGRDTSANTRFIDYDDRVVFSGKSYKLHSVVLTTKAGGHYTAIIRCDEKWYSYNDLNVEKSIQSNEVSAENAFEQISTQGVLFFYF